VDHLNNSRHLPSMSAFGQERTLVRPVEALARTVGWIPRTIKT
jgi:hypothetical protein